MSQFIKSLKTRIQELHTSIEAQKTELAAYQQLLQIEVAKTITPTSTQSAAVAPAAETAPIAFTGNKTTLVADIVRSLGTSGASPKEVDKFFSARKIKRSKNLIYNTLSYLVSQKKLERRDGRYFGVAHTPGPQKVATSATKRRLSPAGLKRIREAVKKRWAAKRAADKAAAK
jgi:hypothetical protein